MAALFISACCIKTRQSHRDWIAVKLHRNKEYIQDTETWSINSCHFSIVPRLFVCSCPFRKVIYQINARNSVSFHTTPHRYEISPPSPPSNTTTDYTHTVSSPCACYSTFTAATRNQVWQGAGRQGGREIFR